MTGLFRWRLLTLLCCAIVATSAAPVRGQVLPSGISRAEVEDRSYLSYTIEVLDNLMTYGTDRYGSETSDMFVAILDVRTKNTVIPEFGDTNWRADTRFERRSPQGANFLHDQPLLRTMYRVSDITGDSNYSDFADSNINYVTNNSDMVDSNGMFRWGWHRWYDVVTDEPKNDGDVHEMHYVTVPVWNRMWAVNPSAVQTEIEQIWERHVVDKNTGQINRHDAPGGKSFIFSSASFIEATAFLSSKLDSNGTIPGETDPTINTWLKRAKRLANYNWNVRDPTTNLVATSPNTTGFDSVRAGTPMHTLANGLLKAYEHTGDVLFRDQALTYLSSWATYAYDPVSENFWGSLELDGTPVPGPRLPEGPYEANEPRGLTDFWQPNAINYEFPPEAAQAYADAYALTGDPALRTTADRWAALIRRTMIDKQTLLEGIQKDYSESWAQFGTYAEHYGRTIDFFLTLFDETGEDHYLLSARDLAKDAVSSLYYEGLFRGHPNKPYYETLDGVPLLMEALVELDQYEGNFTTFGDFNGDGNVTTADYDILKANWLSAVSPYADGDVTGDSIVNLYDFAKFKNELFPGGAAAFAAATGLPEPGTLFLLLTALPAWIGCRRRSRVAMRE